MTFNSNFRMLLVVALQFSCVVALCGSQMASAFEGRITATVTRHGETQTWLYTAGTNALRIERAETNRPYAKDIYTPGTGDLILVFPHNRSFVRLKPVAMNSSRAPAGIPPGVGPRSRPASPPGVAAMPAMPNMPAAGGVPAMPMMMPAPRMGQLKLKATGDKTNLLGYACEKYELRQLGEIMEIWATDKLFPFQPYLQYQPPRIGPRLLEEQWGEPVKAKKLFPLLAILRRERPPALANSGTSTPGPERLRFEVQSVTPEKITDATLFQPPPDYQEIQPLGF